MKILSISDIHDNLASVLKLREIEKNDYDVIFVAGDAGDKNTDLIFKTLASFKCPVFNVYGNWDCNLEYDLKSPNFRLVHHNIHEVAGLYITNIEKKTLFVDDGIYKGICDRIPHWNGGGEFILHDTGCEKKAHKLLNQAAKQKQTAP